MVDCSENPMPEEHIRLKEYIEAILAEREKALNLTAATLNQRLEHLNTLRAEVMSDRNIFLQKAVYEQMHEALENRVSKVESVQSKLIGVGTVLIVVAGLLGAVVTHVFFK